MLAAILNSNSPYLCKRFVSFSLLTKLYLIMEANSFFTPSLKKNLLSRHEHQKLSSELQKLTKEALVKISLGLGVAFLITRLPRQHQEREFLIGQFGLINGVFIALSITAIPLLWVYYSSLKNLKKDLKEQAKIVHQTNIARKESFLLKKKIYARLEVDAPGYHEFEIDSAIYNKLKQGQKVRLEYAPNSKCLLNIDWLES